MYSVCDSSKSTSFARHLKISSVEKSWPANRSCGINFPVSRVINPQTVHKSHNVQDKICKKNMLTTQAHVPRKLFCLFEVIVKKKFGTNYVLMLNVHTYTV